VIHTEKTKILFQIIENNLAFLPFMELNHPDTLHAFGQKIAQYIILSRMDFFSKKVTEQDSMVALLGDHFKTIEVSFYTQGERLYLGHEKQPSYLPIYPKFYGTIVKITTSFKNNVSAHDMVLLDLTKFLNVINAYTQQTIDKQKKRDARLILDALLRYTRINKRILSLTQHEVYLDLNSNTALTNKRLYKNDCAHSNLQRERTSWVVLDYSKSGVRLQRSKSEGHTLFSRGKLVGIQWTEDDNQVDTRYHLGLLRWYKSDAQCESMGIEFLRVAYTLRLAIFKADKIIAVLQEKKHPHITWIPMTDIQLNDSLYLRKRDVAYSVSVILEVGENYTRCLLERT